MKKLKQIIKIFGLSVLFLSTNCNRQKFETYVLENNTDHSIEINFFERLTDSLGEFSGRAFSGSIQLPNKGSLWEFSVDITRGGGGAPFIAFSDFFEGVRSVIDSSTVIYDGEKIEIYTFALNTVDIIDRNLLYNESNIINGDERRYIFTEEDYNNAEVIEE